MQSRGPCPPRGPLRAAKDPVRMRHQAASGAWGGVGNQGSRGGAKWSPEHPVVHTRPSVALRAIARPFTRLVEDSRTPKVVSHSSRSFIRTPTARLRTPKRPLRTPSGLSGHRSPSPRTPKSLSPDTEVLFPGHRSHLSGAPEAPLPDTRGEGPEHGCGTVRGRTRARLSGLARTGLNQKSSPPAASAAAPGSQT